MTGGLKERSAAFEHWQRLARRDRQMLTILMVFLLGVAAVKGVWQPLQERLERAERTYQQRLLLAADINAAHAPQSARIAQPMARHVSDSATSAGLELLQLQSDSQQLRATVIGEGRELLGWLIRLEREGARVQSLTLETQENRLLATAVWAAD